MRTYILGNSIVRGLEDPSWTTIRISGANWETLLSYVNNNQRRFSNSIIYFHIGPVRFSQMNSSRRCSLVTNSNVEPDSFFNPYFETFYNNRIHIILCTIYPLDFQKYNGVFDSRNADFTCRIRSMVVSENRRIVGFNMSLGFATPYMHKRIFTRRHGTYSFRDRFLRDGLHPKNLILRDWIEELKRVQRINLHRVIRRAERAR